MLLLVTFLQLTKCSHKILCSYKFLTCECDTVNCSSIVLWNASLELCTLENKLSLTYITPKRLKNCKIDNMVEKFRDPLAVNFRSEYDSCDTRSAKSENEHFIPLKTAS